MITYKTQLMKGTGSTPTWAKLIDIKDFPDLFAAPEMLETTTLSDGGRRYEPGIKENEALTFTCNYSKTDFTTLKALEGTDTQLAVWFGETGEDGKYEFTGKIAVTINGGGVNEVVEMTLTVALSSDITVGT